MVNIEYGKGGGAGVIIAGGVVAATPSLQGPTRLDPNRVMAATSVGKNNNNITSMFSASLS